MEKIFGRCNCSYNALLGSIFLYDEDFCFDCRENSLSLSIKQQILFALNFVRLLQLQIHWNLNCVLHEKFPFCSNIVGAILTVIGVDCIEFVKHGREVIYEYEGSVNVIAQAQWDQFQTKPAQSAAWKVRGTVKIQRIDSKTLAGSVRFSVYTTKIWNSGTKVCPRGNE